MAIIRNLDKVENALLHDAILITTLIDNGKYKFNKLYIDPNRECAIYFKGLLSYKDMQGFFFSLRDDITSSSSRIEDEIVMAFIDYEYREDNTTVIYTRDGWKY